MQHHREFFKSFITVHPGGGFRRNPKRKNVASYSLPTVNIAPTEEERDRAFDEHIMRMARGGSWGDNAEIVAFAQAFATNVRIFKENFAYIISADGQEVNDLPFAYIAHHVRTLTHVKKQQLTKLQEWEHFSSIRNLEGPHTGLPHVNIKALSPLEEEAQKARLINAGVVQPWQIELVEKSLPFLTDRPTIKRAIAECKGNINNAVSKLIDADERRSPSSTQESSSIERDPDSDDESIYGPNKRRNQRLINRAAHDIVKARRAMAMADRLNASNGSDESLDSTAAQIAESFASSSPAPVSSEFSTVNDDEWVPSQTEDEVNADSRAGPVRLKINPPKALIAKTHVRQQGPQRRRLISAREKKELAKKAQKTARKQRQQADVAAAKAKHATEQAMPTTAVNLPIRVINI